MNVALTAFSFTTANLFQSVRSSKLTDKGFFAAHDTSLDIRYVMADATFYDLEIFQRGSNDFTVDAVAASSSTGIRAIVNGQVYSGYWSPQWQGEIISNSVVQPGNPPSKPDSRYISKWSGRTEEAYDVGRGDPSTRSPALQNAMGSLLPIIQGKIPFGEKTLTSGGKVTQFESPTLGTQWFPFPADKGKIIYGIHRTTQLLFFIAQEDGASPGIKLKDLIAQLVTHGVDDAVMGDGSDSATLVVDGAVEVEPGSLKNDSIPVGLQLRRRTLTTASGTTSIVACTYSPLITKVGAFPWQTPGAQVSLTWDNPNIKLTVTSFGSQLTAADLGLSSLPITLTQTSGTDPAGRIVFKGSSGNTSVTIDGTVAVSGGTDTGTLQGTAYIFILDPPSSINANLNWVLA